MMRILGRIHCFVTWQRVWVCCGVVLFCAVPAGADPGASSSVEPADPVRSATLEGFLKETHDLNPGIRMRQEEAAAKKLQTASSWLPEDPEFGVDAEGQENLFDLSSRTDNEYMAEQKISFPSKLWLKLQMARNDAAAAEQNLAEEKNESFWHAREPYYALKKILIKKTALEESLKLAERVAASARSKYETGEVSQGNLLTAETEIAKTEIEILQIKAEEKLAGAHFAHLVGEPLGTVYRFEEEEARSAFPKASVGGLETLALRKRPHLRSLELESRTAALSRDLKKSGWIPDLVGRIEARDFRDGEASSEYDTFVGVSVPVWSLLGGVSGAFKAADHEAKAAEFAYAKEVNEVRLKVREAYLGADTARLALEIFEQRILPQSRQASEVALAGYSGGKTGFLEMLETQKFLKANLIAYAETVYEYEKNLSDLKMTVGDDLRAEPAVKGEKS